MVYFEQGSIGLLPDGKVAGSSCLKSRSIVTFLMDSALEPFCFGFIIFLFLTGCTCRERLSESESQSLLMKS